MRKSLAEIYSLKRNTHQLFYRPPNNISVIDGLRSLSIMIVVFAHQILFLQLFFPNPHNFVYNLPLGLRIFINGGIIGVNIFFVISGFLIGKILFTEYKKTQNICIGHFYSRRFLRLMPVYWLGLFTGLLLGFPNVDYIWANLIYVTNFLSLDHQFLGWTWSLAVEEQFYFIFPITILLIFSWTSLFRNKMQILLLIIICASISLNFFLVYNYNLTLPPMSLNSIEFKKFSAIFYIKPYTCFISILSGIVVAYLEYFSESKANVVSFLKIYHIHDITIVLSIASIIFMFFIGDGIAPLSINPSKFIIPVLPIIFSASVAYLIFYINNFDSLISVFLKKLLSFKVFYVIAQLSYSIYIFHLIVILFVYHIILSLFSFLSYLELLAIGIPIILFFIFIVSLVTYLFLERPFMNIRK